MKRMKREEALEILAAEREKDNDQIVDFAEIANNLGLACEAMATLGSEVGLDVEAQKNLRKAIPLLAVVKMLLVECDESLR